MRTLRLDWPRPGVPMRLAVSLTSLFVAILLMLDLVFGLFPDRDALEFKARRQSAYSLAAVLATSSQHERAPLTLGPSAVAAAARWNPEILSVGLRSATGTVQAIAGDHLRHWSLPAGEPSTITQIAVPLQREGAHAGELQVAFRPLHGSALGIFSHPLLIAIAALSVVGTLLCWFYLKRSLQSLDPVRVMPPRVRAAFDVLQQGVLIVDLRRRVMMVNDAFAQLAAPDDAPRAGTPVSDMRWLVRALEEAGAEAPWEVALRVDGVTAEQILQLPAPSPDAARRRLAAAATPIHDNDGRPRGVLMTLTDVTQMHVLNAALEDALKAVEESREALREQNRQLQVLATCDPMTNCLNRRAFFERGAALLQQERSGTVLGCIMIDIDHFKRFNDEHGHTVGDQVIQAVASVLRQATRPDDLVCRYGGEEFCILTPCSEAAGAMLLANRLRSQIESHAAESSGLPGLRITASLGVAVYQADMQRLQDFIQRADDALYASKRAGRNRVTAWHPALASEEASAAA